VSSWLAVVDTAAIWTAKGGVEEAIVRDAVALAAVVLGTSSSSL
jgi:hypothetical protein